MPSLDLFAPQREDIPDLETLLTSPEWFGLTTATPVQRALCRVIQGKPIGSLADDADVIAAFGGRAAIAMLPKTRCAELVLLAAIRCGKSLICAAAAVHAALTCDVSICGPGDIPRVTVMSLSRREARATWLHIKGRVEASKRLSAHLIGEPTASELQLRHPQGTIIEISIVAGARAAGSVGSRWSAGVILDEAARMLGEDTSVVNIDEARRSAAGRMLPGAQIFMPGSPHAPFGPIYRLYDEHFGKPSAALVVVHATGPQMNPVIWTPEKCAELQERKPDAYVTDCMAQFLDPESGMFASWELEECRRRDNPPRLDVPGVELPADCFAMQPVPGHFYVASMDAATRGNAWGLTVVGCSGPGKYYVALARQWMGSTAAPLSPTVVFAEMAALLRPYGLASAYGDQWSADALVELAAAAGLWVSPVTVTGPLKLEMMTALKGLVSSRCIELPPLLALLRDLASVRKKITQTGVQIIYPLTGDNRHCDFAPALGLALLHLPRTPEPNAIVEARLAEIVLPPEKEAARREVADRLKRRAKNMRWGR